MSSPKNNQTINTGYRVKSLNYSRVPKKNDNNIYFNSISTLNELNDTALFHTSEYKRIFGVQRSLDTKFRKQLAIVKIEAGNNSIYRKYQYASNISGISQNVIGLTNESIRLLAKEKNSEIVGHTIKVSPANLFGIHLYYWNHPFHATRISYKLGLSSLIIGIISLFIGCVSLCINL